MSVSYILSARQALQEAQRLGIRDCLIKPINADEVIEQVQRYCGR
jgi:response regulator of citrate/malate metabolism